MRKANNKKPAAEVNENPKQTIWKKSMLIKPVAMLVFIIVIVIFYSTAWFTHNDSGSVNDLKMSDHAPEYDISFLPNGKDGIYSEEYQKLIGDTSALVWKMTDEANMNNLNEDSEGIYPGSCGVISFYVTPRVNDLKLKFSFEILGITYSEDESGNISMEKLDSESTPASFLNGHILLFGSRSGEKNYTYSEPILSDEDMKRVINRSYMDQKGESQQVDIYWVWPKTLSTLVDARKNPKVTEEPFTKGDDYESVVGNVLGFPDFYFNFKDDIRDGDISADSIAADYEKYSGYYDKADNDIGNGIDYILLKLSVSEEDSLGK